MTKSKVMADEKGVGDTAVDGLIAGLGGGALMALFLTLVDWARGAAPQATMALIDPALGGSWLSGLLAHLAVSAIYGLIFSLLLRSAGRIRPSLTKATWLWGVIYGLLLWGVATSIGGAAPLAQIPIWEFTLAHILYGLTVGLQL